ncbi:MAG: DUF4194 domain-containing protein [Sphaerochaetaceae bacterium]|nr:DUF4194 domain-containing protein [Sphaerochaetaceae bacterium]
MEAEKDNDISEVVIHLMRGILYRDEKPRVWQDMERFEGSVRDYLSVMNLNLEIYESDGFAYLRTRDQQNEDSSLPRIMNRRQLSYPVSLILSLLRRKMVEHDTTSSEPRLIIEVGEMVEMISTFFPSSNNEVRVLKRIDAHLQRVSDLGFIRFLGTDKKKFEVKRILKAYIDAQWLSEFNEKLEEYRSYGSMKTNRGEDDV